MRTYCFKPDPNWSQSFEITRKVLNCWQCPYHERRAADTIPFASCTRRTRHGKRLTSNDLRDIAYHNFPRWCPVKKGTVAP